MKPKSQLICPECKSNLTVLRHQDGSEFHNCLECFYSQEYFGSHYTFAIMPCHLTSISDRDRHYLSFNQLIRLYNLDRRECVNTDNGLLGIRDDSLIHLTGRRRGDYSNHLHQIMLKLGYEEIS